LREMPIKRKDGVPSTFPALGWTADMAFLSKLSSCYMAGP
jgi:hypothetical protein